MLSGFSSMGNLSRGVIEYQSDFLGFYVFVCVGGVALEILVDISDG